MHAGEADLWTRSPPCQPFTTTLGGKLLDKDDKRCDGLRGIIRLLTTYVVSKPRWIFLENVKGFVGSRMLDDWYSCLSVNGYTWNGDSESLTMVLDDCGEIRSLCSMSRDDSYQTDGGKQRGQ